MVRYISSILDLLVKPIITPRFVPSCTSELMTGLAKLAKEYDVPVQSHLSENHGEIDWVASLHPESSNYTDVYYEHHLMGTVPTVMAHCIHLSDVEMDRMAETQNHGISLSIFECKSF